MRLAHEILKLNVALVNFGDQKVSDAVSELEDERLHRWALHHQLCKVELVVPERNLPNPLRTTFVVG